MNFSRKDRHVPDDSLEIREHCWIPGEHLGTTEGINEQEQIQRSFYPPCDCGGRMAADWPCQAIIQQQSFSR